MRMAVLSVRSSAIAVSLVDAGSSVVDPMNAGQSVEGRRVELTHKIGSPAVFIMVALKGR